ncbi:MAG TPA: NAD-dependent epimerase/dehydratase family protein [Bryobacteraceae bacterium]|jgi:nucleoside-diphosphate-sugar epimerase
MASLIRKAAIFGAAGAIGPAVAREFERRGIAYRVVGRSRQKLETAFHEFPHAEIVAADLSEPGGASTAAQGVDTIVFSVGLPYPEHARFPAMVRTALDVAAGAGVARFLRISNVYSYGVPRTSRVPESQPRFPVAVKGTYHKETEDLVLEAHKKGRLAGMVLRLPDFYGPGAEQSLANPIFKAALAGKTANWVGPVNTPHEFIYVPDAGRVIVDLAECAECYGEAWNAGGPGAINTIDFITRIYRAAGRAPKYRTAGRGLLKILGWFSPLMRELPEMLYLQETPVILDDSKLLAKFPATHKTSYDDGIRLTLDWMRGRSG